MKKFMVALVCFILLVAFSGCNRPKGSEILGFDADEVENIEVFQFIVPMDAKRMIVTERKDMEQIITAFSKIVIKGDASNQDQTGGGEVLSFRFHLKDGSEFVIAYWSGILRNPEGINYKVTAESLDLLWDDLHYEKASVSESELPVINK